MKDHYALVSDDEFAEAAGTTGADLESQFPHAHDPVASSQARWERRKDDVKSNH